MATGVGVNTVDRGQPGCVGLRRGHRARVAGAELGDGGVFDAEMGGGARRAGPMSA